VSIFEETLSPTSLGAQLLARIGRERRDGMLIWEVEGKQRKIYFKSGRPEVVVDSAGVESSRKEHVVTIVRALAAAAGGRCVMWPPDKELAVALGLDTLGEALVGVSRGLRVEDLTQIIAARREEKVEATAAFAKLAPLVSQLVGATVTAPAAATSLGAVLEGASEPQQRGIIALLTLGGLSAVAAPTPKSAPSARPSVGAAKSSQATDKSSPRKAPLPTDPEGRRVVLEILQAYDKALNASHYEILGVDEKVTPELAREAYFKQAKRWHSDRFSGIDIGPEAGEMVQELFRRAGEAQKVLTDPEQRKSYDFVRERQAKGLPTDVNVILEAEGMFQKAQVLVRRGQAAGAEPLLRKAVEMNKGEAEFWCYFGFAVHAAKGQAGVREAREALNRSLEMNPKLAVAHEFLGRIARIEGQLGEAQKELKIALQMNPKNHEAERELRLMNMRGDKGRESDEAGKGLSGLLGGFLKKK
jgi:curved DNA-binding protein CbpA